MAKYEGGGVDSFGESVGLDGTREMSSEEEYETMSASEVLETLEEVSFKMCFHCMCVHASSLYMYMHVSSVVPRLS